MTSVKNQFSFKRSISFFEFAFSPLVGVRACIFVHLAAGLFRGHLLVLVYRFRNERLWVRGGGGGGLACVRVSAGVRANVWSME